MKHRLRRGARVVCLTAALTVAAALAAPAGYADDTPPTNVAETLDDTVATVEDTLDMVNKGCVPYVYEWDHIWDTPLRLPMKANGSVWYRERGGGTPRIICPTTVRLRAWIMDETATSPLVWDTYTGRPDDVFASGATPSIVAEVSVPYTGVDAVDPPQAGGLVPGVRPYGQVTVHVEVSRRVSTGRWSLLPNGCMEFYYLIQPEAGFGVSDPTRDSGAGFASCYNARRTLYDTLDSIEQG